MQAVAKKYLTAARRDMLIIQPAPSPQDGAKKEDQ